ncbi:MAG: shikimate dehydrogenase [Candidatus Endonucleobacter bathymodioli]|uniref:Shikimate dehydrogenase (NADP(+)) n=1 Tax=Candidatus Endonucleibacter bathymodioli TaxID=539814 RepID=A0AA90NK18_9GAMM|nr:shikimate dehydrogenase [Candidatus Endonucleobacter bathymodioli]
MHKTFSFKGAGKGKNKVGGLIDRYAVVGSPVHHSKSPAIHAMFAEDSEQKLHYEALEVAADGFTAAVSTFFNNGYCGLSVTIPFKEDAWAMSEVKTELAQKAGAVNTLWLGADGCLHGDNTDGVGLIRDLKSNHHIALNGARVLIIGAGGAVRGCMAPLLYEHPCEVVIANRTLDKAEAMIKSVNGNYSEFNNIKLSVSAFEELDVGAFDLIINGTSASLQGKALSIPVQVMGSNTICYDMMYCSEETVFNQWAKESGASRCFDGLGMLVEQAAEQFLIWRGVRPETSPVLKMLRSTM